jgi:hypothetical protein
MRNHHSSAWLWAFVDVLLVLTFVQSAFIFLALPQINDPAKNADEAKPAGAIAVVASWPSGPIDCDLWVKSPDDALPVGYSRKAGATWSLLRDDLGVAGDSSPINMENAFARALPAGEWIINVHGYSLPTGPVTVHVEASLNGRLIVSRDVVLKPKQERTVIRFALDGIGKVVAHNEVFAPLRGAGK